MAATLHSSNFIFSKSQGIRNGVNSLFCVIDCHNLEKPAVLFENKLPSQRTSDVIRALQSATTALLACLQVTDTKV